MTTALSEILAQPVHTDDGDKPFGELTLAEVSARANELRAATGWGPTARIAPVARAWGDLAWRMGEAAATTVAGLDPKMLGELAGGLWVLPPGGSLLAS